MNARTIAFYLFMMLLVVSCGCSIMPNSMKPKAKLTGVHFDELTGGALGLMFDVEIKNPYPVGVPVTRLAYSLTSGDQEFVAGSSEPKATIAARSTEEVSMPVKVDYRQMWQALKGIRPGAVIPYKAELVLSMDTKTFNTIDVPISKKGEIELPSVSEAALKKVWELIKRD